MRAKAWCMVIACTVGGACGSSPGGPEAASVPVVNLVLVAGESVHIAFVHEAARADSTIPLQPLPVPATRLSLEVEDDSGRVAAFVPESIAGRYRVVIPARHGGTYGLRGTLDGTPVAAQTVIPGPLTVLTPAADTITEAHTAPCFGGTILLVCVPVELSFDGSPSFVYQVQGDSGPSVGGSLRRYQGELVVLRQSGVRTLVLFAYNNDATEWLLTDAPRGNIAGAAGGFGGASIQRRTLLLP